MHRTVGIDLSRLMLVVVIYLRYSADVVPGDVLILDLGKRISADVRLIETQDFLCGEMALTGT